MHVEAGLRSGDRAMPEEINRKLTDAVSDLLFCTEQAAVDNLAREGVDAGRVFLVGNPMVDTLLRHRERAASSPILETLGLAARTYAVLTLHRPSNVDEPAALGGILDAVDVLQREVPVVWPLHPAVPGGARAVRPRPAAAGDARPPSHGPPRLPRLREADGRSQGGADRFRGRAGGGRRSCGCPA